MTRAELIQKIAGRFPSLELQDADMSVRELLDAMSSAMIEGQRVEIRGFGAFTINYRKGRTGRNPKTGESVQVAGKYVPHFKPGNTLREAVQNATS